jgi:hypothetical protein
MACPGIDQLFVESFCLVNRLVSCLVVFIGIKLGCAVGRSDHMDDGFIPPVPQLDGTPSSLIEQCLPHLLRSVSLAIHDSSVTNDNRFAVSLQRCFQKDIFEDHLRFHDVYLELDGVAETHLVRLDHSSTLHH